MITRYYHTALRKMLTAMQNGQQIEDVCFADGYFSCGTNAGDPDHALRLHDGMIQRFVGRQGCEGKWSDVSNFIDWRKNLEFPEEFFTKNPQFSEDVA